MFNYKIDQNEAKLLKENTIKIFFQHPYIKVNKITQKSTENEGIFEHPKDNEISIVGNNLEKIEQSKAFGNFNALWYNKFLKQTIKKYDKCPIIQIVLSGEQDNNVIDGTILNADRLKELIESLDLKNKILVFDNITCQGAVYLPNDKLTVFERIKTIIQELDEDKQPNELHLGYQANGFRNMTDITNRQIYTKNDYFCEKKQYDFLQETNLKKISFTPLGIEGVNNDKNEDTIKEYNDNLLNCIQQYQAINNNDTSKEHNIKNDSQEIKNKDKTINETQQILQQNNQYQPRCSFKWYHIFMPWKWCSCSSKESVQVIEDENHHRRSNERPQNGINDINGAVVYNDRT